MYSDDRFRGFSLSDGHPVAILELSYDAPDGLYAAASGTLVASSADGVRPLGLEVGGGYAKRLSAGLTIDVGAVHSEYSEYSGLTSYRSYSEAYVGVAGKLLSSRIAFSPRYLGGGATSYAEVDGHLPAPLDFMIEGHAGVLVPLYSHGYGGGSGRRFDWEVGLARPLGRFSLHAAVTGAGPGREPYAGGSSARAVVLGVSCAL